MAVEKPVYQALGSLQLINWSGQGACVGMDTDMFYPDAEPLGEHPGPSGGAWQAKNYAPAIAVCGKCPVMDKCRDYAIITDERYGVWGGTTPEERVGLRRHYLRLKKELALLRAGQQK